MPDRRGPGWPFSSIQASRLSWQPDPGQGTLQMIRIPLAANIVDALLLIDSTGKSTTGVELPSGRRRVQGGQHNRQSNLGTTGYARPDARLSFMQTPTTGDWRPASTVAREFSSSTCRWPASAARGDLGHIETDDAPAPALPNRYRHRHPLAPFTCRGCAVYYDDVIGIRRPVISTGNKPRRSRMSHFLCACLETG